MRGYFPPAPNPYAQPRGGALDGAPVGGATPGGLNHARGGGAPAPPPGFGGQGGGQGVAGGRGPQGPQGQGHVGYDGARLFERGRAPTQGAEDHGAFERQAEKQLFPWLS